MKKTLALLLAVITAASLVACGGGNEAPFFNGDVFSQLGEQSSHGGNGDLSSITSIDFESILSGNGATDVVWGKQSEATKQQLIDDAKKEGVDVSFSADGSMTVVDTDGTVLVQKPDGTWAVKDAEGGEGKLGGNWPDNEFTKLVPKPDFQIVAANTDAESFSVVFGNVSADQIKAYATAVEASGFNINEAVHNQEMMGMVVYSYAAENAAGYKVEINSAAGVNTMTISK